MTYCFRTLALALVIFAAPAFATEVTDFFDQKVSLDQPAQRIVALAPHIVENVFSAGAGDRLIAAVSYSDYPPAARELPQLGSFKAISVESVLALEPDLVLAWASGNGENVIRQMRRLGLNVYTDEPRDLEDVARVIRDIGALAGTEEAAEKEADRFLETLAGLRQRYSGAEPVSVFYQVWNDPLQTLNGEHIISDVIRLCGGRNVYADAATIAPVINRESILDRDPEVIVASGMGEERPEWLEEWRRWPGLTAVSKNNLFFVPPDIIQRHTVRILDGAQLFCDHIAQAREHLQ
ncbi:cobalamin-binding protein [Marinimicrobium sp. ABcell2]|uniref:cobalamin-binding protein n=1 Tax=Marinimicrobium sp. ABcell2 TaxID=3069751 RepID=UPI0027B5281E|nr:cobalamin-binding protein [Marinimicrobium sp. ABcell2]MDQ2076739.1 cobalamin-binding protein [Marinimicrobium sp. ABcell2]